jgi:hypothetical protein
MLRLSRFLPSSTKARIALASLCLVLAIAGWKFGAKTPPKSALPPGELDFIQYAVGRARSWRVTTVGTLEGQPFQTDQDVVCPYDSHTVTRLAGASGESSVVEEFIETRDMSYVREGGQPWHTQPGAGADKCRGGPMAGPASLLNTLENLKASSLLRRGTPRTIGEVTCRDWYMFLAAGNADGPAGSVCVDDLTHLPYELRMGQLLARYSNWNGPALIEPPARPRD